MVVGGNFLIYAARLRYQRQHIRICKFEAFHYTCSLHSFTQHIVSMHNTSQQMHVLNRGARRRARGAGTLRTGTFALRDLLLRLVPCLLQEERPLLLSRLLLLLLLLSGLLLLLLPQSSLLLLPLSHRHQALLLVQPQGLLVHQLLTLVLRVGLAQDFPVLREESIEVDRRLRRAHFLQVQVLHSVCRPTSSRLPTARIAGPNWKGVAATCPDPC